MTTVLEIVNEELPEELEEEQTQYENNDPFKRFPVGRGEFFREGQRNPTPTVTSDDT